VLSQDGLISFKARGVKKNNSKMNSILFNYAYSEFEVNKSEKSGYLTLLDGNLLDYPSYVISNLEYLTLMGIVSEGISKCSNKNCLFINFKDCLKLMENKADTKNILIAFLNFLLESEGIKYESDGCVNCSSKQVTSFDFDKGGFLCKKCSDTLQDIDYLKKIRIITKINFENASKANLDSEKEKNLYIVKSFESLENKCGIEFKGKDFLFKILKLGE
jgi:DNA repair protein RecO